MWLQTIADGIEKMTRPIRNIVTAASCAALALMMFLTALDVALRYIFNSPIPGGLELVEYLMAVIVPFALTVTAFNKAHIGVDLIMEQFSRQTQAIVGCVTHLLAFGLYLFITWQGVLNIGEQYRSGMTSAVLLIPHYPFVASLTAAFGLLTVITLMHFFERLHKAIAQWTHF